MTNTEMEASLIEFVRRLNDERPETINSMMRPEYEGCDPSHCTLLISFDTRDWMSNPAGVMHGGLIATALDVAMGSLSFFYAGEKITPTISLQTSFIRPIPLGEKLMIEARVTSSGRTVVNATADAWAGGKRDRLLSTGTGVYFSGGK